MNRAALPIAVLFVFTTCSNYKPSVIQPDPVGVLGERPTSPPSASPCREVARTRCAVEACAGPRMDYVTLSCAGGETIHQCVANVSCSAE